MEEIDEFADCIQTGAKPETDGQAGLNALSLIRAAIESNRTGKEVNVATLLENVGPAVWHSQRFR